jgi:hypothetical protein
MAIVATTSFSSIRISVTPWVARPMVGICLAGIRITLPAVLIIITE